jgi:DNA-binding HxlR family transcriptional regulator
LEAEGIVSRSVIPATPVRVEYHLTAKGRALAVVVASISAWAEEWVTPPASLAAAPTPDSHLVAASDHAARRGRPATGVA